MFKDGDIVRAKKDVHSEFNGSMVASKGQQFTLRATTDGNLRLLGSPYYLVSYHSYGNVDRSQFFELVPTAKRMTVAQIRAVLGYEVEIVER